MVVELIERKHAQEGAGYQSLCENAGLECRTFMRWRERVHHGQSPAERPGPSKVQPLNLEALGREVQALQHGRRRSTGTGELYEEHRDEISRRDLNELVREERVRQVREHERAVRRIRWENPRLVWAMDDTEYRPDRRYPKAYLHNVQDLGSRYKFAPLVGLHLADGIAVAGHLSELFADHGPPLFIKRDNGGNLNHREVNKLLSAALVIPINSPCYYPQYNGSIEHAQGEIKDRLARHSAAPNAFLAIQAEVDVQELNHKIRRDLNHRTPCAVFASGHRLARTYTRRKRREVYDTIYEKMLEFISEEGYQAHSAWRLAVEIWLLDNGFITVSGGGKV